MEAKKTLRWCKTNFGKEVINKEANDSYLQDCIRSNNVIGAYRHGCHVAQCKQKAIAKELIDMLIQELYTSRQYHLGITGLDSAEEIARKEREGNTALIRGIDSTIKYVKEAMEE